MTRKRDESNDSLGAQASALKRRQRGKGRPWAKGGAPKGVPFPKGYSGNPGGIPQDGAAFRSQCRSAAAEQLRRILAYQDSGQQIPDSELRALEVLSDRGGWLAGDRLAQAEATRGRLLLDAMSNKELTEAQRDMLMKAWQFSRTEALGDNPVTPQIEGTEAPASAPPPDPPDES